MTELNSCVVRGLVADVTADVRVGVTQWASQYRELSHGNNLITITQFYSNEGIGASLFCLAGFVFPSSQQSLVRSPGNVWLGEKGVLTIDKVGEKGVLTIDKEQENTNKHHQSCQWFTFKELWDEIW